MGESTVTSLDSVLMARRVTVRQGRRRLLEPTSLEVATGEILLVSGEPGHGHTCLALVLSGRLAADSGGVTVDGSADPAHLRAAVALVDVPGVSAPDDGNRLTTIVSEELAMAKRPASRRQVKNWLAAQGYADMVGSRIEALPGAVRVAVLARLAVLRPDVRFVVIGLPEQHGGLPEWWLQIAEGLAAEGFGVVVTTSPSTAASLEVRVVELGGAIAEVPA
jgi:ABC-type transport system involved in cytochrome c biogenesis ATPase subunit